MTWALTAMAFMVFIVMYAVAIYAPLLRLYKEGCVTGQRNGTFATNNLYATAYNYASSDGNQIIFDGLQVAGRGGGGRGGLAVFCGEVT